MKKLVYICCWLYVLSSNTAPIWPIVVGTSPVTMPGTYHYLKSKVKHEDTFRPFVTGSLLGMTPILNVVMPAFIFACKHDKWEKHEPIFDEGHVKGWVCGASLYAAIPLALKHCRR